jgi:DNA repair exonuclease SbcCD ATPase subunit
MMADVKKLIDFKKKIDEAKIEKSKYEARLQDAMTVLEEDYCCKNLKEAQDLLNKTENEIEKVSENLESEYDRVCKKYEI